MQKELEWETGSSSNIISQITCLKVIQISKYRGKINWFLSMCECPKVHMYEVEFKMEGMIVVPTHKNCGVSLNDKQAEKFQKELMKTWGFEEEEE